MVLSLSTCLKWPYYRLIDVEIQRVRVTFSLSCQSSLFRIDSKKIKMRALWSMLSNNFKEEILISAKLWKPKIVSSVDRTCTVSMNCDIFKKNTLKLSIDFKMAYSNCFSLRENIGFLELLQNIFITLTAAGENYNKEPS